MPQLIKDGARRRRSLDAACATPTLARRPAGRRAGDRAARRCGWRERDALRRARRRRRLARAGRRSGARSPPTSAALPRRSRSTFPQFTDGRGYSIGALLRERYGFTGELRAIGDVLRDQLFYLARVRLRRLRAARRRRSARRRSRASTTSRDALPGHGRRTPLPLFRTPRRRDARRRDDASRKRVDARATRCSRGIATNHSPAALASSFGAEDMVLIDLIARDGAADRRLHARHRPPARRDATR